METKLGRKITKEEFGELRKLPEHYTKTSKTPFATMKGEWQNTNNKVIENRAKEIFKNIQAGKETEWIEVGFNPKRHGFFYSKIDGLPVTEAEEIIQVGPLVLAKKANKVNLEDVPNIKDFKTKEGITFKQGGQIATGLAGLGENIVYRAEGDQVGSERDQVAMFDIDDRDIDLIIAGREDEIPTVPRADAPVTYEDVIIDYDNNEIYADPLERTPTNPEHIDEGNLVSLATKVGFYDRDTMPH